MVVFGQAARLWHLTWQLDERMNREIPEKESEIETKKIMRAIERMHMMIKHVADSSPLRLLRSSCERLVEPSCKCIRRLSLLVDELS